jgi:hypothetical protein
MKKREHKWTNRNSKGPSKKPELSPLVQEKMAANERAKKLRAKLKKPKSENKPRKVRIVMNGLHDYPKFSEEPKPEPKYQGKREWRWVKDTKKVLAEGIVEMPTGPNGRMEQHDKKMFYRVVTLQLWHGEELVFRIVKRRQKTGKQIPDQENAGQLKDEYYAPSYSVSRLKIGDPVEADETQLVQPPKPSELSPKTRANIKFSRVSEPSGTWIKVEGGLSRAQVTTWLSQHIDDAELAIAELGD